CSRPCLCCSSVDHRDLHSFPTRRSSDLWEEAEISTTFCLKSADFCEIPQKPRTKAPQSAPIVVAFPKGARRTPGLRQPTVQEDIWLSTAVNLLQQLPKNPAILPPPSMVC